MSFPPNAYENESPESPNETSQTFTPSATNPYASTPQGFSNASVSGTGAHNPQVENLRSNSTIVLILGIAGFFFGLFAGIPAWVWGNSITNKASELGISPEVVNNARIGKILGIVTTLLSVLGFLMWLLAIIAFVGASDPVTIQPYPVPTI